MAQPSPATSSTFPPSETAVLDQRLAVLSGHKDVWATLPLGEKIAMARRLLRRTLDVAERQVQAATRAKSIPPNSPLVGEEWLAGPMVTVRNLRLLIETLEEIATSGRPQLGTGTVRTRHDGQTVVDVFPASVWDRLLFSGFVAEIWMEPGVTPQNLHENIAGFYRESAPQGKVALVLGAGNVASIGPLDVVHKLFVEGQVCILKMNPVNEYLGPFIEEAFAEFIERGFVQMAYGGAAVGDYLCTHELVEEIHITGSHHTHDAIVFGSGKEGAERKQANKPRIDKRITSELGNVSPVIVVPGPWSNADLRFHAENLATQIANNAGFNCNAARVIITHKEWDLREAFLDHLRQVLSEIQTRNAYYPGAEQRFEQFVSDSDLAEAFGQPVEGHLPWAVLFDVDPEDRDHIGFSTEAFCGVKCETALSASDPDDFLKQAVTFANERVWGTLSASIIIHPSTARRHAVFLEASIARLRYGSVAINHWPALSYGLGVTTWGAFPGHTLQDIQSGIGVVHNSKLFDRPQKSVIRGPFRVFPKPPWFVTNKNTHRIARNLTHFEADPSAMGLASVVKEALRG